MKKKVLVVDDSPFALKQIQDCIEQERYEIVDFAKNGEEGLAKYRQYKPDIITVDIVMPGITGIEMSEMLLKEFPDANIILVSSMYDEDTIAQASRIGVFNFISKPVDKKLLLEVFERVLDE